MQDVFQYLLKWSIALGIVFLFYRLVLRPLTFYQWNRRYLIVYSILAFFIPFINLYTYVQPAKLQDIKLVQFIPVITLQAEDAASQTNSFNPMLIACALIIAGSIVLLARLIIQWYSLLRIRRNAVQVYHPHANVYHVDENVVPFSFGDSIYVNTALHTEQELNDIILHEFVHVKQKHSFDIIWSEVLCILNWYNPFAWLIRHAIRQNLEFIADQAVLNNGLDKKTYQYHLLKVIGNSQYSIANKFNFSSLKKRIAMMNRLKTARVHLVKFLFALPLIAVLLVAFRNNQAPKQVQEIRNDTIKKPEAEQDLRRVKNVLKQGYKFVGLDEFYKQNPSVKEVAWSSDNEIVLYLKNGTREAYRSENDQDLKKLADTYGGIPAVFPVRIQKTKEAPLPPEAPVVVEGLALPSVEPGEATIVEVPIAPVEPKLPEGVVSLEEENNRVTLKLHNGKKEVYDLNKPEEKAAFEKKYGKVIHLTELPAAQPRQGKPAKVSVIATPTTQEVRVIQGTPEKAVRVEGVPATKETRVQEPVIRLEGVQGKQASVSMVSDKGENILYSDKIEVKGGVPEWQVRPGEPQKLVYYLNGKKSIEQNPKVLQQTNKILHAEIITDVDMIRTLGETQYNGLVNLVTTENVDNKSVYIAKESKRVIQDAAVEREIRNTMYFGVENPIDIKVADVPENEVIVKMVGGKIIHREGRYYAVPEVQGNIEINIYRKVQQEIKLINKRVFRVKMPSEKPTT